MMSGLMRATISSTTESAANEAAASTVNKDRKANFFIRPSLDGGARLPWKLEALWLFYPKTRARTVSSARSLKKGSFRGRRQRAEESIVSVRATCPGGPGET